MIIMIPPDVMGSMLVVLLVVLLRASKCGTVVTD